MDHGISDKQLLREVIKRKPLYDDRLDGPLRNTNWQEAMEALAPLFYSDLQKRDLESYLRRKWFNMRNLLVYYFDQFFDLVSDVADPYTSNFEDKAMIFKYMCSRVSNLVKYFILNESELEDFQNYFDSRLNILTNNPVPQTSETVSTDSVAMQTEVPKTDQTLQTIAVSSNSNGNKDFFTNLNNELLKLPEAAKLRMQDEIMKLVRQEQSNNTEKQQSTIDLIKSLLDETATFQSNMYNCQLDQISRIRKQLQLPEPQPGPSSYAPRLRPPPISNVKDVQSPAENRFGQYVSAPSDQGNWIDWANNEVEINSANQFNTQPYNVNESSEFNIPQNDIDMGNQYGIPPSTDQDYYSILNDNIPIEVQFHNHFIPLLNDAKGINQPSTSSDNRPSIRRNELNITVHMCDEFITTLANTILCCKSKEPMSLSNPAQNLMPRPRPETSSVDPSNPGLSDNRKRNASDCQDWQFHTSNQSQNPSGNVTSDESSNPEPNPRDSPLEDRFFSRNLYLRSDNPGTSNDNYSL